MKRIISLAFICLSLVQLIAQSLPQGIAYQAVAVKDGPYSLAGQNPQAIYWSNKDIKVRFTIYEKYPGGSTQYSEFHATKTDDYGVFNLIIGQGNPISGDFTKIPWDLGTAHLQVEIDFDNNGTYKLTSLERFWSVPYAFVTRKISSTSTDSALNALNSKFNYLKNRDKDTVIGNEGGVSYKSLDSLNKVLLAKLAALKASDKDTVIGNEWQKLTRNKDTLILSDGGGKVTLLDEDPKNELQNLVIQNDSLKISKVNGGIPLSSLVKTSVTNGNSQDSLINVICSQNSWLYNGGNGGGLYNVQSPDIKPPGIVHGDTVCFGDYSFSISKHTPVNWSAKKVGQFQDAIVINQDSILIVCGYSKSFSANPRTVHITNYPNNNIVFNMDVTYASHPLTSFFEDLDNFGGNNGNVVPAFYYKDTLAILKGDRLVVLIPKKNQKILDINLGIINTTGFFRTTGFFQIKNSFYFIHGDTLKSIDFKGNVKFVADFNFVELSRISPALYQTRVWGQLHKKHCIPLSENQVFIVNGSGQGVFYNLNTKKTSLFTPQVSMFPNSLNYYYDGKAIYHTRQQNTNTGYSDGFYTEKINVK
jgi:hypothetical protein